MLLADLPLKDSYRTGRDDLLKEFYIPALSVASQYDRAVGYFSSSILSHAAQGIAAFFAVNRGRMRLIFGGELSAEDYEAIRRGLRQSALDGMIDADIDAAIRRLVADVDIRRFELLSLLLAVGRLEIKFAIRPAGMFHDKFGILQDSQGKRVAFDGSANESAQAFLILGNWERIRVYRSWVPGQAAAVEELGSDFENLWAGRDPNCVTVDLPTASRERLIGHASKIQGTMGASEELELDAAARARFEDNSRAATVPCVPKYLGGRPFEMRPHQLEALRKWRASNYRGIAALCTGAGKTVMALYAAVRIYEARDRLALVVGVPYIALAEQWGDVLGQFGFQPIQCWSGHEWRDRLLDAVVAYRSNAVPLLCVVAVNATMSGAEFQQAIAGIPSDDFFFVGDECHHHRNAAFSCALPENAAFRLGLSATPLHYRDDLGNIRLRGFYGDVVASYALKDALSDGVLTQYEYFPIIAYLAGEEMVTYRDLSAQIARLYASGIEDDGDTKLSFLLRRRAEIIAVARDKEAKLEKILERMSPTPLTLVYCGVDGEGSADGRQIERVAGLLARFKWTVARYTAKESAGERQLVLESFRLKFVDALVAMKCLDEGVDIPGCATAFMLASTTDPRQFIQRRGRVLRRAPGKEIARIYDFIVVPECLDDWTDADRRLVARELSRVGEFADSATNRVDAIQAVREIARKFDLLHALSLARGRP